MNPKDLMYTQRRFTFLHLVSFVVFIAVLAFAGYSYLTKASLEAGVAEADTSIANLQEQVAELEEQSLTEVTVAQSLMTQVEEDEIKWSEMIMDLLGVTPLDVYYASYSGNTDGQVTVSGLADSYDAVAGLIDALEGADMFDEVFIPSVAVATSGDSEMVSFGLSFVY